MKKLSFLYDLLMVIACLFSLFVSSCSEDDEKPANSTMENKFPKEGIVVYENLGDQKWDILVVDSLSNFLLVDKEDGKLKEMIGRVDLDTLYMNFSKDGLPDAIESSKFAVHYIYSTDTATVIYNVNTLCVVDTLVMESFIKKMPPHTRSAVEEVKTAFSLVNEALDKVRIKIPDNKSIKQIIKLLNYFRDIEDSGKRDYLLDNTTGKGLVSEQLLRNWLKIKDSEEVPPSYIVGILTGNTASVKATSAVCYIDGILKMAANDGSFKFDYGICYSQSMNPTVNQKVNSNMTSATSPSITVQMPSPFTLKNLSPNTTYYYRAYCMNQYSGKIIYAENIKSFKTKSDDLCPDDNHPHAIDLGLPSGTKWCCCNVGASKPVEYGGYYAWGETNEKNYYSLENYVLGYYDDNKNYQYYDIGSDIAGTSYDVAYVCMGAPWHMPSIEEIKELIDNCSHQWAQQNSVDGIFVKGPNGSQIFFPATGSREKGNLNSAGSLGRCWSSSLDPSNEAIAYYLGFGSVYWYLDYSSYRCTGRSIRAVCP